MGLDPTISNRNRDHMANERTFLSWIRTSMGLMAFGFVIERFSLFLRRLPFYLGNQGFNNTPKLAHNELVFVIFGIILVIVGGILSVFALFKFKEHEKQIENDEFQSTTTLATGLTVLIVLSAIFLTIYLIFQV